MTFAVLNLVVAIILNAFTWCYSLEPTKITSDLVFTTNHLLHFKVLSFVDKTGVEIRIQSRDLFFSSKIGNRDLRISTIKV